jgi:hypothetical protein
MPLTEEVFCIFAWVEGCISDGVITNWPTHHEILKFHFSFLISISFQNFLTSMSHHSLKPTKPTTEDKVLIPVLADLNHLIVLIDQLIYFYLFRTSVIPRFQGPFQITFQEAKFQ